MSDEPKDMSTSALKAFLATVQIMKTLRHDLNLSANEQWLALGYAMLGLLTDTDGMTEEEALGLLKQLFEENRGNAKAGFENSKNSKRGGAK